MARKFTEKEYDFALSAAVDAHAGWLLWESEKGTLYSRNHEREWLDCKDKVCTKRRKYLDKKNPANPDLRIAPKTDEN